jgi:hypothetical protein
MTHRPRRILFRHLLWTCSLGFVLLVLGLGTWGFMRLGAGALDAFYSAIQLFGLNFDLPEAAAGAPIPWELQAARLLAPAVLIAAVIKLMADGVGLRLQRHLNTRVAEPLRDLVLGFGPFGQEIGRRLVARGRKVTWIDHVEGNESDLDQARATAERLGGFLIAGDPSDPVRLREARIDRAKRVFVALPQDLAGFDAAEAVRRLLPPDKPVRVFTANPVTSNALPSASAAGFATGRGFDLFNIRAEAVRRLVLTARWDDLALLLGQERVHLVIAGCGWQGEALLEETLLLCNRAGLKTPLVTVLDLDAEGVRRRLQRRALGLVAGKIGVEDFLPPRFLHVDLETVDLGAFDLREEASQWKLPVTAWAICTGDDDLNLRAGLHLHTAIQTRRLDGAPVHIRVCSGHAVSTHAIGTDGITLSSTFGSIEDGLDQTAALEDDPDEVSKRLNRAYMDAKKVSPGLSSEDDKEKVSETEAEKDWAKLSESKRNSNRRAHRHAPMKLADLGFDWRGGADGILPRLKQEDRKNFHDAHEALHARAFMDAPPDANDASRLLAAMLDEHDRWAIDRALDGWTPAAKRDESRLLHDNMVPWEGLGTAEGGLETRAYDAVLIRALIDDESPARARPAHRRRTILIDIPNKGPVRASCPAAEWKDATELRLRLPPGDTERPERTVIEDRSALLKLLKTALAGDIVCRMTLLFPAPPVPPILNLGNDIVTIAGPSIAVQSAWLWRAGPDHVARLDAEFGRLSLKFEVETCAP